MRYIAVLVMLLQLSEEIQADECAVPAAFANLLFRYEAWSDYWLGTRLSHQEQDAMVFRDGGDFLVYMTGAHGVFTTSKCGVSFSACGALDYRACIERARETVSASFNDALLGIVAPRTALGVGQACRMRQAESKVWSADPPTDEKDIIIAKIACEVARAVKYFGSVKQIPMADFAIHDPEIWGVATVDKGHTVSDLIVGLSLCWKADPTVFASVVRTVGEGDRQLRRKISRRSLRVPLGAAGGPHLPCPSVE